MLLSFARTVVAFQIAYRTNLKSNFFSRKKVRAWALLFLSTSPSRNPLALRTLSLLSFFPRFFIIYFSHHYKVRVRVPAPCAPNYSMKKHYTIQSRVQAARWFVLPYPKNYFSFPSHVLVTSPPFISRARISSARKERTAPLCRVAVQGS